MLHCSHIIFRFAIEKRSVLVEAGRGITLCPASHRRVPVVRVRELLLLCLVVVVLRSREVLLGDGRGFVQRLDRFELLGDGIDRTLRRCCFFKPQLNVLDPLPDLVMLSMDLLAEVNLGVLQCKQVLLLLLQMLLPHRFDVISSRVLIARSCLSLRCFLLIWHLGHGLPQRFC